ncbi:MAG: glycosyltransferase family 39 protein [Candidatus Omnitrophota bacterium]
MMRKKTIICLIFIMLYISIRLVLMMSSETLIRQGQEAQVGCLTQSIIDCWGFDFWRYPVDQYMHGSVLNALIAIPFFYLFGPHMLSLMLASLLFHACGLTFLFYLMSEHFGRRAAIFSCLLYTLSPPLLTARGLIFSGAHAETVVFGVVIFFLFFKILQEKPSIIWYMLFGFISGLSIWYIASNGIFIISCFIIWTFIDRTFFIKKKMGLYCIGFLVGITPLLLFHFANPYVGATLHRNALVSLAHIDNMGAVVIKLKEILCTVMPNMFLFNEFAPFFGHYFDIFYYSVFMVSLFGMIGYIVLCGVIIKNFRREQCDAYPSTDKTYLFKIIAIISVPIIFSLLYAVSKRPIENFGFGIADYRYTLMLFPFIFMIIALFLDILCSSQKRMIAYTGYSLFCCLIIISIIGQSGFVYSLDFNNRYLLDSGYNYELIGRIAARRYDTELDQAARFISTVQNDDLESDAYRGYGETLANKYLEVQNIEVCTALGTTIDNETLRADYFRGIGIGCADIFYSDTTLLKKRLTAYMNAVDEPLNQRALFRGLLDVFINRPRSSFSVTKIIEVVPETFHSMAYFKWGLKMGSFTFGKPSLEEIRAILYSLSGEHRRDYVYGVGAGIGVFFTGNMKKCVFKIDQFPPALRTWLWQGVGMYHCFKQYGRVDNIQNLLRQCDIEEEDIPYVREYATLLTH